MTLISLPLWLTSRAAGVLFTSVIAFGLSSPLMFASTAGLLAAERKAPTATKGNVSMKATLSNTHVLMPGNGTVHMALDLKATKTAPGTRLPMNLALVIDRSGSMRGEKIQNTREAARHLINTLKEDDMVSIVSYATDVRVDFPATLVTDEVKKQALDAIGRIHASGSTNLSGGLFRGQQEVEKNIKTGQVNRVILMSDGLANHGITDTRSLAQQAQKSSQKGLSVTTMGVGADYNEDLMTAVADHAGGNYYFVKNAEAIANVFSTELKKMFATVAQGAEVVVELDDGVDLKQVFGYTFRREGDKVIIPLAEIYAGQKRSILLELGVPVVREGKVLVGKAVVRYIDVASKKPTTAFLTLGVAVTKDKTLVENGRNRSVEERIGEVRVASTIHTAAQLLKQGRGKEAQALMRREAKGITKKARAMGGSARLMNQVKVLESMDADFGQAASAPAAAAPLVKKAKARSRSLAR